jgi:hypothetical protein
MNIQANLPQLKIDEQDPNQSIAEAVAQMQQFRQDLYNFLPQRADALLDLVDALASNSNARSVVELSLSPLFRRAYSSVHDAIDNFFVATSSETAGPERRAQEQALVHLIAPHLPAPTERGYWLFGIDVTYAPRRFAETLADRTLVHQPNVIRGNKPVTIGHDYSVLVYFPEKDAPQTPPWVVPLIVRRVTSGETANQVGAEQIAALMTAASLPFHDDLCVQVADSAYSAIPFLGRVAPHPNLVSIVRLPSNRVVYRQFQQSADAPNPVGHPTWYGARFALNDPSTWSAPDVTAETTWTTRRGRTYRVQLQGWYHMLRPGSRQFPMHRYPFTLVRARVLDANDQPVYPRDLWLVVIGHRRTELALVQVWHAYGQRYDLEHFFRFGKQRLLMGAYQTPDVEHEENGWQITQLAYIHLWLARSLAEALPRPWERYLPQPAPGPATPARVQRDFERIISQVGTPARAPKRRGNSPGRAKGTRRPARPRQPVLRKGEKVPQAA